MERMEIRKYRNNSKFDQDHLLQTNDTATVVPNSCCYSDLEIYSLDILVKKMNKLVILMNYFFMEKNRDNCFIA